MRRVIYKKQYGPVERIAELAEEGGPTISAWGKEVLVSSAIEFSKKYRQGIEISEDGNELGVDLYLTDHFFMGEGKEQLTFLFAKARRVDFSLGTEDILLNFYYEIL